MQVTSGCARISGFCRNPARATSPTSTARLHRRGCLCVCAFDILHSGHTGLGSAPSWPEKALLFIVHALGRRWSEGVCSSHRPKMLGGNNAGLPAASGPTWYSGETLTCQNPLPGAGSFTSTSPCARSRREREMKDDMRPVGRRKDAECSRLEPCQV